MSDMLKKEMSIEDRMHKVQNEYFSNEKHLVLDLVDTCRKLTQTWEKSRLKDESDVEDFEESISRLILLSNMYLWESPKSTELLLNCLRGWEQDVKVIENNRQEDRK